MYQAFNLDEKMKSRLKALVEEREGDFAFQDHPLLASLVACLGLSQEVGTVNDELHRHIFFKNSKSQPSLKSMKAEIISWKGQFGVRVFSTEVSGKPCHTSRSFELDHPQLEHLLQPEFSFDENGDLVQLVIFPNTIAKIIELQNVNLTIVKDWALNTVFGGFDTEKNFYVTNEWEIRQNDGLRMARLISERKLAFFGTHDLVAHVAGTDGLEWNKLQKLAEKLIRPMGSGNQKAINHLIAPYIIGVLLDDLAQPFHYGCENRLNSVKYLARLQRWIVSKIEAKRDFEQYPKSFSDLIEEPRKENFSLKNLKEKLRKLSLEIQVFAVQKAS